MKKFLTLTLALLSAAVFACQYPQVPYCSTGFMRYIYISGVNRPDNHIASVEQTTGQFTYSYVDSEGETVTGSGLSHRFNFTCKNNIVLDLPLTVYVAATPRTRYGSQQEYAAKEKTPDDARLVLHLQYRVLPSTTWVTAKTVRLDNWQVSAMDTTGKPLFGSYAINPAASYGSTVMIRLYITAEPGESLYPGESGETGTCPVENADISSMVAESLPDSVTCIAEVGRESPIGSMVNNALNLCGTPHYFGTEIGESGWTYEQVMTVVVSGKRRPGK